jgi:tetratricopeptide (TPR) repeat protein
MNNNAISRSIIPFSIVLFLIFSFLLFTGPIVEGDFFWHLATGQWIWQNKTIPDKDPFSHTSPEKMMLEPEIERYQLILKQYWLGQVILYWLWKLSGPAAIVLFRAIIHTIILTFIFFWTRKQCGLFVAFILAFLLANLLREFPNERPQIFTFLFTPVAIYLLEQMRKDTNHAILVLKNIRLPLLMLLWSNIHGGYILGIAIIIVYITGEGVNYFLKNGKRIKINLFVICLISILITLLNPNTYKVFLLLLEKRASYRRGVVHEYLSPLTAMLELHEYYLPYLVFLSAALIMLIIRFRRMQLTHLLLIIMLGGLSLVGLRFMPYLLMTAPILCGYINWRNHLIDKVGTLLIITLWIIPADKQDILSMKVDDGFPEKAVEFIKKEQPSGRIFNFFHWGGYLMYFLPEYDIFIDGRVLLEERYGLYESAIWRNNWKEIFSAHHINTVLLPGMSPFSGEVFPLPLNLMMDNEWFLVYMDNWSLLFLKDTVKNKGIIKRFAIKKEFIYDQILAEATRLIKRNPEKPGPWRARAEALLYKGDLAESLRCYRKVLDLSPDDERAMAVIKRFEQPR